jgi:transposase
VGNSSQALQTRITHFPGTNCKQSSLQSQLLPSSTMPRPSSAAVRERVLAEVAMRDLQPAKSSRVESIATIAYRFRISESTVRRWIQQEKDETAKLYGRAVKREPKPRGRPRKLSAAETRAIVDFVERSRANWDPVTIATVRQFAAQSLGRALSPSYVSRMLRREGYTSQKNTKEAGESSQGYLRPRSQIQRSGESILFLVRCFS